MTNEMGDSRKLSFGKYKGHSVKELIAKAPSYLLWADANVPSFSLTNEERFECELNKEDNNSVHYDPYAEKEIG